MTEEYVLSVYLVAIVVKKKLLIQLYKFKEFYSQPIIFIIKKSISILKKYYLKLDLCKKKIIHSY